MLGAVEKQYRKSVGEGFLHSHLSDSIANIALEVALAVNWDKKQSIIQYLPTSVLDHPHLYKDLIKQLIPTLNSSLTLKFNPSL